MKHILYPLIIMSALLLAGPTQAEERVKKTRWYQVNLTLFQQVPDSRLNEAFVFEALQLDMADTLQLKTDTQFTLATSGMNAVMALHHENSNGQAFIAQDIDDDWRKIIDRLDPIKQPILHNAQWVQPVYGEQHSLPVYFESAVQALRQAKLKGLIEIHVSRYLHSDIRLQYTPKQARNLSDTISLRQKRRMRSKEIHYLDHPYVAALIRIMPLAHPLKKDVAEQALKAGLHSVLNERI